MAFYVSNYYGFHTKLYSEEYNDYCTIYIYHITLKKKTTYFRSTASRFHWSLRFVHAVARCSDWFSQDAAIVISSLFEFVIEANLENWENVPREHWENVRSPEVSVCFFGASPACAGRLPGTCWKTFPTSTFAPQNGNPMVPMCDFQSGGAL